MQYYSGKHFTVSQKQFLQSYIIVMFSYYLSYYSSINYSNIPDMYFWDATKTEGKYFSVRTSQTANNLYVISTVCVSIMHFIV